MSENWYLMTTPNQQLSGFESDYFNEYATDSFNELLNTFVGDDVTIYNSTMSSSVVIKGIVQSIYQKKNEKQILLPLNTCSIGMYVKHKNLYWLITDFVDDNKMYQNVVITLCNFVLKFQSPTGTILSYPCITSNKTSGSGENSDKLMTLGNGMKSVKLPYDERTVLLHNDENKTYRFFLDLHPTKPVPYALTFADTTSYHFGDSGIIELIVKEDVLNPDTIIDRIDLGICDYFTPDVIPDPIDPTIPTEIVTITSDTTDNNVILGIEHTFSATFKNELGVDIANVVAVYSVDNTYGGKVILVDNHNGIATVTVGDFDDTQLLPDKTFTLRCFDATHGFESTVLLTIVGLF